MTTSGEGGMVTTNDEALWRAMWSFKDHGKSYEAVYERQHSPRFRWLHESFGTNWHMLKMQAVIGRIQLRRMKDWSVARARNAQAICAEFAALRVPAVGCTGCSGNGSRVGPGMTVVGSGMTGEGDGLPRCARSDGELAQPWRM